MSNRIGIYSYKTMRPTDLTRILNRSSVNYDSIYPYITKKIEEVKTKGDEAILSKYRERKIPIADLRVSKQAIVDSGKSISRDYKRALKQVIKNITIVNEKQLQNIRNEKITSVVGKDIFVWRKWKPLDGIGIYVPGGNANYPSSLLMCAIPAIVAGCKEIIVCCPPDKNGNIPNEVIYAAKSLGIFKLFKIGGPQAIAAMAYGTATVPKVQKIVGPGNNFVTAAKLLVYPNTSIDMPAGPSENLIIADKNANPKYVAADLITDTEHGIDSTGILLTESEKLAKSVKDEINIQINKLYTKKVISSALAMYGAIIVFNNIDSAVIFANEYAPEHIQIMTKNPNRVANKIRNAGSVFIGPWSTKSSGDYVTGATHVLPTGAMAKTFWPLSIEAFGKMLQYQKVTRTGLKKIRKTIGVFADVERLPAHKNSVEIRFKDVQPRMLNEKRRKSCA